jgi:NTE family protein
VTEVESPAERYVPRQVRAGLAICLSGGGFRATLFHAGALRRLNDFGILSRATSFSSVSGGSIANGLLATVWPELQADSRGTFTNWVSVFEDRLRAFCSRDIRTGPLLWQRLNPANWPRLARDDFSVTDLLAEEYRRLVGDRSLHDLGGRHRPKFVFCASNVQTGVNFEFRASSIGDYVIGYREPEQITVAEAIGASSAFTFAFPPMVRHLDPTRFHGGHPKAAPVGWKWDGRLSLTDGGVYDNMGLEPVWKTHEAVFVSDGGTPFALSRHPGSWLVPRLLRAYGISANQSEAVRKRWLVSAYARRVYQGAYWGVGTEVSEYPTDDGQAPWPGYRGRALDRLRRFRTDLDAFGPEEQDILVNHGWCLANAAVRRWCVELATAGLELTEPPHPALLAPSEAEKALEHSHQVRFFGR